MRAAAAVASACSIEGRGEENDCGWLVFRPTHRDTSGHHNQMKKVLLGAEDCDDGGENQERRRWRVAHNEGAKILQPLA